MKIRLFSDLHLERCDYDPPAVAADVVVLAGDIHNGSRGVAWAARHFAGTPVVYVAGNHEYHGGRLVHGVRELERAAAGTNVHVLDSAALVVDGVRFLGATLWADYGLTGNAPVARQTAQQGLSDFKRIRDDQGRSLRPARILEEHQRSRRFLEQHLVLPFDGPTVVVSHHAPSARSIHPRYHGAVNHLNATCASHLDMLMGVPALWLHGHMHDSFDYELSGTRVVCNPRGYTSGAGTGVRGHSFNPDFDSCLVLEV